VFADAARRRVAETVSTALIVRDPASVIRLVGAVPAEQHAAWLAAERRDLSLDALTLARRVIPRPARRCGRRTSPPHDSAAGA
jgi:hypothetical protein